MSDLASPLLLVMRDEAEAFWAFVALLDYRNLCGNFDSDQQVGLVTVHQSTMVVIWVLTFYSYYYFTCFSSSHARASTELLKY